MPESRPNAAPPASSPAAPKGDNDGQIRLAVSRDGGAVVVEVGGEVDMLTSPRLRATVLDRMNAPDVQLVVLDLNAVTFLGTSGLAVLIELREAAHAAGIELRLVCSARRVLRPLTIAGLVSLFTVHDSQEDALADA